MNTNKKIIITAIATLAAGLLLGWLLFKGPDVEPAAEHVHEEGVAEEVIYTCSMHPQIRQNEPGDCPICGMDLIPLESDTETEAGPLTVHMSPTAIQLANIHTGTVGYIDPVKQVRLNGKVETDERQVYSQSSHIPGRIESLAVNFTGDYVQKGQAIATIYSPDLVTAQEELLEAQKIRESQPQLFRAAREKLRNWKLSDARIDQILASGEVRENFEIYADVSGYVTEKMVNKGDYVSRGATLFKIANLARVWVLFDLYESDMQWVNKGDRITFTVESLPGEKFESTISYIDPVIDPQTRVAKARVEMANPGLKLKPEMFVTGTVEAKLATGTDAVVVPKTAVMWTGKRSLVYVKAETERGIDFMMREVTLGPALGESFIVESGLEEGEEIAINGTFSIDAAAQLAGKASMMMPPVSKTLDVPENFREQITVTASRYFDVKNALVNDDAEAARTSARELAATLDQVKASLPDGKALAYWTDLRATIAEQAVNIAATDEIEKQRGHFRVLSQGILELVELYGLEVDKVYRQFCPMAFDNEGAFWLSESDKVLNPYFGDMMLNCGEVKETYRKGQRVFREEEEQPVGAMNHNH